MLCRMTKRLSITATPREPITIDLVGIEYVIDPPKSTYGIKLARRAKEMAKMSDAEKGDTDEFEVIEGWVEKAFGPRQAPKVLERLMDDEDDLDIPHIMNLIEQLAELVTDTPTSSSSD